MTRVSITYSRRFTQAVRAQFCWLHEARIDHACDETGCWPPVDLV